MKRAVLVTLATVTLAIALAACSSSAPNAITSTVTTTLPGPTVITTDVTSETMTESTTVVSTVPTTIMTSVPTTVVTTMIQTVPETILVTVTSQPSGKTVPNGDYLVGTDITTGTWQCRTGGSSLYWETSDKGGDTIANDLGSIARVLSNAYAVKLSGCDGDWTHVG